MGLETIIKISIGLALFSVFGNFINNVFYYFFYSIKYVFSRVSFVFHVLWASEASIAVLYYVSVFGVVMLLVSVIKRFLYK